MNPETHKEVENFFKPYPIRRYNKGQILIFPGESTEYAYFLLSGRMKVYDVSYRGDEIMINAFKNPAFFPLSLVITRLSTRYIYEVVEDIEVRRAPLQDTLEFLNSHPAVVFDLFSHLYTTLDRVLERLVYSIAGSAKVRMVHALIVECRQFGQKKGQGYDVAISEKELASRAGLSRETVSREAKTLKTSGLIVMQHTHIIVPNIVLLEDYLSKHA